MAIKKKTLYEILAVAADASQAELQAAFNAASAKLEAQKDRISADDFDFKVKVLQLAFGTLSDPGSRGAYDAKLASTAEPPPATAAPALALVPIEANAEALSLRAEAMALRADAMTMRADAMALRTGAAPVREKPGFPPSNDPVAPGVAPLLRKILVVLGTLFAIAAVTQSISLLTANRRAESAAAAAAQASEKAQLEEYFQTHGVRPANKTELAALEAENRRKEIEKRTVERQATKAEQDARRFEEESRRRGEQVSAELRMAELRAKEQAQRDDERRERQQKEDQRMQEQTERMRIERQKAEWRETLRR